MDGASIVSQQKQNRPTSHSVSIISSTTPLEQLASAFCSNDETKISSCIDFQAAKRDDTDGGESQEAPPPGDLFSILLHPSDHQQAILSSINQAKDTLLWLVNPHLRRNQCHRLNEKYYSNARNYWSHSQQGSLLSLDHKKLLDEVNLFSPEPEEPYPNFSRFSATFGRPVSSGAKPSRIKKRLKWTADLHEKFVHCVNLLGGAEKATPRAILKLMKSNGLTLLHVKSHLQKYRYAKCITDSTEGNADQRDDDNVLPMLYLKSGMQVKEILKMQVEVQRHLCQQLEIQQNLQQAIEEQGKQILMVLEELKKKTN